jgi:catechol 2,3-dioxygenase
VTKKDSTPGQGKRAENLLPATLTMGAVTLRVANLDLMSRFYQTVGLEVVGENTDQVILGRGTSTALVLEHQPSLKHAGPREAGLFHTAFLFPTETALAAAVWRVADTYPGAFTGVADHVVSEAFYFDDPEGNGVELYRDQDRASWRWSQGFIHMDTLPLDPRVYLNTHLPDDPTITDPSVIGHVHLCVGDVEQAKQFYVDTLGFETTLAFRDSALFVSAGGYHHHMAMNVWRSRGAGRRLQTLGLGNVTISLDSSDDLLAVMDRLRYENIDYLNTATGLAANDPWGNLVTIEAVSL